MQFCVQLLRENSGYLNLGLLNLAYDHTESNTGKSYARPMGCSRANSSSARSQTLTSEYMRRSAKRRLPQTSAIKTAC